MTTRIRSFGAPRARIAAACLLVVTFGCRGGSDDPSRASSDVHLPGVDTADFTPREQHEFSRYVRELPAPCASVAAPIATCILEHRACDACVPAARAVAKGVREGMAADQIESLVKQRFDEGSAKVIPVDGSPVRGPDAAPVTLVEFADFECPFCQQMAPKLDELWSSHRDSVRFVYKFMPLAMHPHGEMAARAAIAAQAQGKFWEMHHTLFTNGGHLEESDLLMYAKALGLDVPRFTADMNSAETTARLERDRKLADDLGVRGTPTIYVNGRELDARGNLTEWVDGEISAARGRHAD